MPPPYSRLRSRPGKGELPPCEKVRRLLHNNTATVLTFLSLSYVSQVLATEEARELAKSYTLLVGQLADFENENIEAWGASIQASIEAKLKNPLLIREADRLLRVNFDPLIVRLLREVKYFLLLGLRVPESALEVRGAVR